MTEANDNPARLLEMLERLLAIQAADLDVALTHATDAVAVALSADKVDAFIHDPTRSSLVARGTSNQPLSALQRKLGLDVLPLANGGRVPDVFQTGRTYVSGRVDQDLEELRGVREALGIRSQIGVPLEVGGERRGVVMIASRRPDFFTLADARFAESVTRWLGVLAHRAALVEEIAGNAVEQGRRAVAEELVTVLAHDLRNYMQPIGLRLQLIRRRAEKERRDLDLRDIEHALRGLDRLGGLIGELLDVARIDQGVFQIEMRPVDLVSLIGGIAAGLATPDAPIVFVPSEEIVLTGDPDRLRQCLENLLANAAKHSPKGAPVTVKAQRADSEGGEVALIEVMDQGPGVDPEVLPRLFDRFVSGERRGLGLGLFLVGSPGTELEFAL